RCQPPFSRGTARASDFSLGGGHVVALSRWPMNRRLGVAVILSLALAGPAFAERPRLVIDRNIPVDHVELPPNALLPYNTIYINRCASGCTISPGTPNSKTNRWYGNSTRTLTPFPY